MKRKKCEIMKKVYAAIIAIIISIFALFPVSLCHAEEFEFLADIAGTSYYLDRRTPTIKYLNNNVGMLFSQDEIYFGFIPEPITSEDLFRKGAGRRTIWYFMPYESYTKVSSIALDGDVYELPPFSKKDIIYVSSDGLKHWTAIEIEKGWESQSEHFNGYLKGAKLAFAHYLKD